MELDLQIAALRTEPDVTVNGQTAKWNWVEDEYGVRRIEIAKVRRRKSLKSS
jgi:hypothetical protein